MANEALLVAAEAALTAAGVSRERWLYISANRAYTPETPPEHRLGGFSCDWRWILKDCVKYPQLY